MAGFAPSLVYDGSAFANAAGGARRAGTYSGNLNARVAVDLEALAGWPGMRFYVDGMWVHGGRPSSIVGDAQGVSNTAAAPTLQVEEVWVQKNFTDAQVSVLAGIYDLASEFYRLQSAGLFLNSSFGTGAEFAASGVAGPSIFPFTSAGLRIDHKPDPGVVIRTAILDGVPVRRPEGTGAHFKRSDGALLVGEVALLGRPSAADATTSTRGLLGRLSDLKPYDNKLAVGTWHYTASFDDLSDTQIEGRPLRRHGSSGAYVIGDGVLMRDRTDAERRTTGFVQLGAADPRVSRFAYYLGSGLVATKPFGRPATDQWGVAIAVARNGSHYINSQIGQGVAVSKAETAIELSYQTLLRPWLALQPDVQYVIRPNTDPNVRNALAFTLRFELTLGR